MGPFTNDVNRKLTKFFVFLATLKPPETFCEILEAQMNIFTLINPFFLTTNFNTAKTALNNIPYMYIVLLFQHFTLYIFETRRQFSLKIAEKFSANSKENFVFNLVYQMCTKLRFNLQR